MANLIKDYSIREQSYLRCFVEKNERKTHKFMNYVKAEVDKQEELLKGRLLKRIKSQNQLWLELYAYYLVLMRLTMN